MLITILKLLATARSDCSRIRKRFARASASRRRSQAWRDARQQTLRQSEIRSTSTLCVPSYARRSAKKVRSKRSSRTRVSTESVRAFFNRAPMQGGKTRPTRLVRFSRSGPRYERVVEDFLPHELNLSWSSRGTPANEAAPSCAPTSRPRVFLDASGRTRKRSFHFSRREPITMLRSMTRFCR